MSLGAKNFDLTVCIGSIESEMGVWVKLTVKFFWGMCDSLKVPELA